MGRWTRSVDPATAGAARANYAALSERADWPHEWMNRVMLATFILPMAALYTASRDQGRSQSEAADTVLVFDAGRLVERGPHRELVGAGGVYTELHRDWQGATAGS